MLVQAKPETPYQLRCFCGLQCRSVLHNRNKRGMQEKAIGESSEPQEKLKNQTLESIVSRLVLPGDGKEELGNDPCRTMTSGEYISAFFNPWVILA